MSVLVAAFTRTKKNNFSLHNSDSKMSSAEQPSGPRLSVVKRDGAAAPAQLQSGGGVAAAAADADGGGNGGCDNALGAALAVDPVGTSQGEERNGRPELHRQFSSRSYGDSDEDECDAAPVADVCVLEALGPMVTIKEQLEKDKEDESLRRWKEKLLGSSAHLDCHVVEPEVKFLSLGLMSPGRPALTIPLPLASSKGVTFSLKEGSVYRLMFTFTIKHNIVSGLKYVHTVWKAGLQVDHMKIMLGTFSPQREPYVHLMDEETTPSGMLARGAYTAKTKFVDDDERCYLEINYSFDIRKDW